MSKPEKIRTNSSEATEGVCAGKPRKLGVSILSRFVSGLFLFCFILAAAVTFAAFGARFLSVAELFSHFRLQYAAILAFGSIYYGFRRKYVLSGVCLLLTATNAAFVLPVYFRGKGPEPSGTAIRIVSANVQLSNRDYDRVLSFLHESGADIIAIYEIDREWWDKLDELSPEYPFRFKAKGWGQFGIAVFSRLEVKDAEYFFCGGIGLPSIRLTFAIDGVDWTFIATHLAPPPTAERAEWRNRELAGLSEIIAALDGPAVLVGDLNITPYSPYFGDFLRNSGLRDSRNGFGIQPTWPTFNPLFYIPIDHCLVSDSVAVRDRKTGPRIGSDHLPVIVEVANGE